jgi:hypothetical protein
MSPRSFIAKPIFFQIQQTKRCNEDPESNMTHISSPLLAGDERNSPLMNKATMNMNNRHCYGLETEHPHRQKNVLNLNEAEAKI